MRNSISGSAARQRRQYLTPTAWELNLKIENFKLNAYYGLSTDGQTVKSHEHKIFPMIFQGFKICRYAFYHLRRVLLRECFDNLFS